MAVDRLEIIINSKATGQGVKETTSGLDKLTDKVGQAVLAYGAIRAAQAAINFVKFGGEVERAGRSLDNLAKAAGTSGDQIVQSIQGAADFTIDKMTAMQVANRAMVMDVAQSPAEFERLTKVAVTLGRAMGQDAAKSIDDFVTASARQSTLIADNLGLMVKIGPATENYAAKLGKTVDQLTEAEKRQAFLNEMLTQGEKKMEALDSTTMGAAEQFDILKSALKDTKTELALFAAQQAETVNLWGSMANALREVPGNVRAVSTAFQQGASHYQAYNEQAALARQGTYATNMALHALQQAGGNAANQMEILRYKHTLAASAFEKTTEAVDDVNVAFKEAWMGWGNYGDSLDEMIDRVGGTGGAIAVEKAHRDALERMAQAATDAKNAMADFGTSYSDLIRNRRRDDEEYAEDAAAIEAEHQEKLAEIAKKGQATRVKIDVVAEEEKLYQLQEKLKIAWKSEQEFTDKTKESTRMAKDLQVENLEHQVEQQMGLLDDYHAGRLVKAGMNTSALLAEEDARYQQELAMLAESRAAQEEEQRRSLGQMLIQNMEAYGQMNGWTADEMFQMRLKIAEQYGLITEAGKAAAETTADSWAREIAVIRGEADSFFAAFRLQFDSMPTEKRIRISYELAAPKTEEGRLGGVSEYQHGVASAPGGLAWVGEGGPELMYVPRGSRITPANVSKSMTANFNNSYNVYDGAAAAMLRQQQRQQVRRAFERGI